MALAYESLNILKVPVTKEGWMHKAASAKKGKDEVRKKKWRRRYFVLKKNKLHYYKQKEDADRRAKPKGEIELKNAKIDPVDDKITGYSHCFKIYQLQSQIYTYIQAPSRVALDEWVFVTRKAAGYDTDNFWGEPLEMPASMKNRESVMTPAPTAGGPRESQSRSSADSKSLTRASVTQLPSTVSLVDAVKSGTSSSFSDTSGASQSTTATNSMNVGGLDSKYGTGYAQIKSAPVSPRRSSARDLQRSESRASRVSLSKRSQSTQRAEDPVSAPTKEKLGSTKLNTSLSIAGRRSVVEQLEIARRRLKDFPVPQADAFSSSDESYVLAWGNGLSGQLGNDTPEVQLGPVLVRALATRQVRSIAVGRAHVGAITEKGIVYMWGKNDKFQLGIGKDQLEAHTPQIVHHLARDPVWILACGDSHTVALSREGLVYSWGDGEQGQLGHRSTKSEEFPRVVDKLTDHACRYVAAGGDTTAAIVNEHLCTWGDNKYGQLGSKNNYGRNRPVAVTDLTSTGQLIRQVAVGVGTLAVVMENGKLYTCGNNSQGQLGYGGVIAINTLTEVRRVEELNTKCLSVSLGCTHMMALVQAADGSTKALTWGSVIPTSRPMGTLDVLNDVSYVSGSQSHLFVLHAAEHDTGRRLWGSGSNQYGQLGTGTQEELPRYAKVVLSNKCEVVQVECGLYFTVALCKGQPPSDGLTEGPVEKWVEEDDRYYEEQELKEKEAADRIEEQRERDRLEAFRQIEVETERMRKLTLDSKRRQIARYGTDSELSARARMSAIEVSRSRCAVPGCDQERAQGVYCIYHERASFESRRDGYGYDGYSSDPEPLPPGWRKVYDESGRPYYVNPKTQESQWRPPPYDAPASRPISRAATESGLRSPHYAIHTAHTPFHTSQSQTFVRSAYPTSSSLATSPVKGMAYSPMIPPIEREAPSPSSAYYHPVSTQERSLSPRHHRHTQSLPQYYPYSTTYGGAGTSGYPPETYTRESYAAPAASGYTSSYSREPARHYQQAAVPTTYERSATYDRPVTTYDRSAATYERPAATYERPAATYERPAAVYNSRMGYSVTSETEYVTSPHDVTGGGVSEADSTVLDSPAAIESDVGDDDETVSLPKGWYQNWDANTSRFYYYNKFTGVRQWKRPT